MHTQTCISLAVIIFLLIIILSMWVVDARKQHYQATSYLRGLWSADEDFCHRSDIDGMLLYVGEYEDGIHPAYIIMYRRNAIILEKKIRMQVSGWNTWWGPLNNATSTEMGLHLHDMDTNPIDSDTHIQDVSEIKLSSVMPTEDMTLVVDLVSGCMRWEKDGTMYAKLYKDNVASL